MQPLDAELKTKLVKVHACLAALPPEGRLNHDILEQYDGLVHMHGELCRILQDDPETFKWPVRSQPESSEDENIFAAKKPRFPFDRLFEKQPASAHAALHLVEDTIRKVLEHYMPYFRTTYEVWACTQQHRIRAIAQRAYRRGFGL